MVFTHSEVYWAFSPLHMHPKARKCCRLVDLEAVVDDEDTSDVSLDEEGEIPEPSSSHCLTLQQVAISLTTTTAKSPQTISRAQSSPPKLSLTKPHPLTRPSTRYWAEPASARAPRKSSASAFATASPPANRTNPYVDSSVGYVGPLRPMFLLTSS